MKTLFIGLICFAALSVSAQNREIIFKDADWKTQLEMAKKENKLIFLDAYTSWCGPCKMMAKDVFTRDSVADFFNATFYSVKYDMEKGEGPGLREKYNVDAFPTYLFIDGNGEVVHKIVGSMPPPKFIKEASKALTPENTAYGLAKKFNAGDHSDATTLAYLDALEKAYESEKMGKVSKIYFDKLPKASLLDEHNWQLTVKYLNNPSSDAFAYLYANKEALEKKYSSNEVNMYFNEVLYYSLYSVKMNLEKKTNLKETKEMISAIRKLEAKPSEGGNYRLAQLDLIEFASVNNWDKFVKKADVILNDKNFSRRIDFAVSAGNDIVTAAPIKYLQDVEKWANKIDAGEKNNPILFNKIQVTDLRKRILKKQGKTTEAKAMAEKAEKLRDEAMKKGQMTPGLMRD